MLFGLVVRLSLRALELGTECVDARLKLGRVRPLALLERLLLQRRLLLESRRPPREVLLDFGGPPVDV
jgi:hypothetical protein